MSAWILKIPHLLKLVIQCMSCTGVVTALAPGGCEMRRSAACSLQVRTWLLWAAAVYSNNTAALRCFVCTFLVLNYKSPTQLCLFFISFNVSFPPIFSLLYLPPFFTFFFTLFYFPFFILLLLFPPFPALPPHHPVSTTRSTHTTDVKDVPWQKVKRTTWSRNGFGGMSLADIQQPGELVNLL